ncbi:hypothetical protein LTR56_027750 [Elasticomyces elasticus]|nr:hypothetical protein LTR56_027750 [Elasticomyces elasticus]KAK3616867.1 hypothetical protein LTR22_026928 [Elasticomyces elasticus]
MKRDHDAMLAGDGTEENANTNENDDDMEEGDIEMDIPPYDLKSEGLPSSPIFTPEFAELGKAISEVVQLLAQPIEESSFSASATSEDDEAILDTLWEWADALMVRVLGTNTTIIHEASTTQSLLWSLAPFQYTVEQRDGEPMVSPWPFVSYIRFGLDSELLKAGVVLCDLPGLSDANQTRVNNAMNHLRQCSHYMIISEVGRATDNQFIKTQLAKGCMTRGSGRTILVLTHCDNIDDGTEVYGTAKDYQSLSRLQEEIDKAEEKVKDMTAKMKSMRGSKKYVFMHAKDQLVIQHRQNQNALLEQRINMRSKTIVAKMQEIYRGLTPDPVPLPVFCVGSAAYKKHQAGFSLNDPSAPCLSADGTGIPALRQHLLMAPGQAQVNEKTHTVQAQLPALLCSFNLYVMKTHMARKGEVEAMVAKPRPASATIVENLHFALNRALEDVVLEPFRNEESRWVEDARDLCKSWAKNNNTTQHLTLLKNNGFRKIKGRDAASISWSAELISINAAEIRKLFLNFDPMLNQVPKDDPQVTLMALAPFVGYLKAERETIARMVEDAVRNLRKDISNSMTRSMSEMGDNYIAQAMLPVYSEAREIKGRKGTVKDRLINFERNLCKRGTGVWGRAHDALRAELENMTEKHTKKLNAKIQAFFLGIEEKFSMLCGNEKEEVEGEVLLRETLQKALVLASVKMENEVRPLAEKCFGKF